MKSMILVLKGLIIGIGRIIPGVSGSVIAISLGVYEQGIDAISNFFKNPIKNLKFILALGIGIVLSVIYFSKLIAYLLDNYYLFTMTFFIGLIIGGIPSLYKKINKSFNIKNILIFIITFSLVMLLVYVTKDTKEVGYENYLILIVIGIIDAATMIIPGISGTAVLMLLGFYEATLDFFASLGNINLLMSNIKFVVSYAVGLLIGGIAFVKLMEFLLKKHNTKTYFAINAFAISSIFMMMFKVLKFEYSTGDWAIAIAILIVGYLLTRSIGDKEENF